MAKRSCRRTAEENRNHDFAVKIRKMTDEQLVKYINDIQNRASISADTIPNFINALESANIKGIGKTTISKIKKFHKEGK